jgi:hypothetical protein
MLPDQDERSSLVARQSADKDSAVDLSLISVVPDRDRDDNARSVCTRRAEMVQRGRDRCLKTGMCLQ